MAKSMTGYGRARSLVGGRDITFEVKSVNNRFLDLTVKMSRLYNPLEDRIKQLVRNYTTRGKVDVYLTVDNIEGDKTELSVNREFVDSYVRQLRSLQNEYELAGDVDVSLVASRQETFITKKSDEDMESVWAAIEPVAREALEGYFAMRRTEGEKLKDDILSRIDKLEQLRNAVSKMAPASVAAAKTRMLERVKELCGNVPLDEARLITECAVYADKSDITEEIVRLGSHFSQLRKLLSKDDNIGKTVDFLLQETNREINTIGSKSSDVEIANIVVEVKSELEKIREQIQNIE